MISTPRSPRVYEVVRVAALLSALIISTAATESSAVTIRILNRDPPGQGFNDNTPVGPVGGNPGTTLGAQRLFLFHYAADAWGLRLVGEIPIVVTAYFLALGGTSDHAILGSANATTAHIDFPGAPLAKTWYVAALASQLYGYDQNDFQPRSCPAEVVDSQCPEIFTVFNSDVDGPTVLGSTDFYYGLDGNNGSGIDFLSVLLHELAHGLGILSLLDPDSGAEYFGFNDAYSDALETRNEAFSPKELSSMINSQRGLAIRDDGNLVWTRPAVRAATDSLTSGTFADGAMKIFAPANYQVGSSTSHVDVTAAPNELMEPYLTNPPPHNLDITLAMLEDIGWTLAPVRCGDPNEDTKITAGDALLVLKGAVGSDACPKYLCNVDGAGGVTAVDALILLKASVGLELSLNCPLA